MEVCRRSSWLLLLIVELLLFITPQGIYGELDQEGPSESECRPHIEKALKQLESGDTLLSQDDSNSQEDIPTIEITTDDSDQPQGYGENEDDNKKDSNESIEIVKHESNEDINEKDDKHKDDDIHIDGNEDASGEQITSDESGIQEVTVEQVLAQEHEQEVESIEVETDIANETYTAGELISEEEVESTVKISVIDSKTIVESLTEPKGNDIGENNDEQILIEGDASSNENEETSKHEEENQEIALEPASFEDTEKNENLENEDSENPSSESTEDSNPITVTNSEDLASAINNIKLTDDQLENQSTEDTNADTKYTDQEDTIKSSEQKSNEEVESKLNSRTQNLQPTKDDNDIRNENESEEDSSPVEELIEESKEETSELRSRDHISQLLKLNEDSNPSSKVVDRMSDIILRDLKKLYDTAIKPLETLYKYKDLSNRHYGDSEIFAKPLILFMGPWSGGKSSIINYLVGLEYTEYALHTGAEPSPAYFNILMYGEEPETLDGTQLASDYTFSGLQKFGQGLEERLRGYKLPSPLLDKVNVVEIPGILEVRKQVSRVFPFNDACQWFIDRADIIFLVYDPSKLDVGPETEAILDQLKGREHQTRIILNKADQVKPEELMRVQGALIWNISPLMSSAQPPVMYTTSLWSKPYETWAPVRLLQAQERAFLRDIRSAVDKRIDNKISSARRFAVRVRNHAKMVDCYLTTYYNHKSVFGNRKQISDEIINHPQDFHIYEGLSTLTNISRYDLPDPDVYRDFFRLNALYDFQQLSATCTYFRGCPINRLDIAIAYDLPELIGKHKKLVETALNEANKPPTSTKS